MQVNKERLQDYAIGETRIIKKFYLFPTYTKEDSKGRWLERVRILQSVEEVMNLGSMDFGYHKEWVNIKFLKN